MKMYGLTNPKLGKILHLLTYFYVWYINNFIWSANMDDDEEGRKGSAYF